MWMDEFVALDGSANPTLNNHEFCTTGPGNAGYIPVSLELSYLIHSLTFNSRVLLMIGTWLMERIPFYSIVTRLQSLQPIRTLYVKVRQARFPYSLWAQQELSREMIVVYNPSCHQIERMLRLIAGPQQVRLEENSPSSPRGLSNPRTLKSQKLRTRELGRARGATPYI